jgi:hypothetical protein
MRVKLLAACLVVLVAAAPAAAMPGGAGPVIRFFQTPSMRIHCGYSSQPAFLRCDVDGGLRPRPPRPAGCHLDWAQGLSMGRTGRARIVCAGDTTADPSARVLRYGQTWARGGFRCHVPRRGLRCENAAGHGFFVSASGWRRF